MVKNILYCVFVVCFYTTAIAQNCNYTFKGNVTDFHDKTPIVGASLQVLNTNIYTTTDVDGNFEFKNICTENVVIEIKHIACETKQIKVNLKKNTFKTIFLEHHLEALNEVIISANTKLDNTNVEQSLSKKSIDNFTDKSLGDALNTISGVSSLNTGNSIVKPMIQGLHSSRLLIINNNVRLFDQEWGEEHAPNIDINAAYKISVIKGANTLKYGSDAIGGLILIMPKKYAFKDSIFGSTKTSFNSNGLGGNLNTEIVKTYKSGVYVKLQANYKQFGDFKTPDYYLTNTGVRNTNASFTFGKNGYETGFNMYYSFINNNLGILQAAHIGNVNDLVNAINSDTPRATENFSYAINFPKQEITHYLGKADWYKRFSSLGKLNLQYDFQVNRRKEFDLRRGDLKDTPVVDLRLFTTSFQSDLELTAIDNLKINTGVLLRYQQNDAVAGTGASPLIPDFDKYDAGIYAIGNYNLDNSISLQAGLRYDFTKIEANKLYNVTDWNETYNYDVLFSEFETGTITGTRIVTNPKFNYNNISASFGFSKTFNNSTSLMVNYGLASRVPNPSELFSDGLHHGAARIEIGALTIDKEIANKFVVSLEKKDTNFGFVVSPFYKRIQNFVQLIPTGVTTTIRGAFPVWEYSQTNAELFGIDIDINKKLTTNVMYSGAVSLIQGTNLSEKTPLIHMPAVNFKNNISYTNQKFYQLKVGINHTTVLQQNRYPDYNFFTFNPTTQNDVFVDISSTPPAYSLFGINTSAVFSVFKKDDLQVDFNIDNLFNTTYRDYLNRFRYFADELGRNFNIKIKINY